MSVGKLHVTEAVIYQSTKTHQLSDWLRLASQDFTPLDSICLSSAISNA